MGFKADSSFLRFLTMGARGARHVIDELKDRGFAPIELERYSTSHKIWSTKIKRLRLPDLLCVRTGLRVEVRAKATLEIRMSHAPNNADRRWDTGLRGDDLIAFVPCHDVGGIPIPRGSASYFEVADLRASDHKQSAMKAASEGSEVYLTWPSLVSKRPGRVLACTTERLSVEWRGDGASARRYVYDLKGRHAYASPGQEFDAGTVILAGTPAGLADLGRYGARQYRPLEALHSDDIVDRYSAAKAIPFRPDLHVEAKQALARLIDAERDKRMALEVAGSAAAVGVVEGAEFIGRAIWNETEPALRMEAVFIATELGARTGAVFCRELLSQIAADKARFEGDELRQAAVWGLGRAGMRAYPELLPYLADEDENLALHAIAAFGSDADIVVIGDLIRLLGDASLRRVAAASEALRGIGSPTVLAALIEAARAEVSSRPWVMATLGRLPEPMVKGALAGDPLLDELTPLLLAYSGNWLSTEELSTSLHFLLKQVGQAG